MKMLLFLILALLVSANANANANTGGIFDNLFNYKVSLIYKKAMRCQPLEIDIATGKSAREWMEEKPAIPDFKMLNQFLDIGPKARDYAQSKIGSDKVKHCFAGCFIRKKLDLKSAIMIGWLKELTDSSDCSENTHFEEADYLATIAGAIAGKKNTCERFCQRDDIKNASGQEMLEIAKKENHLR